MSNDHNYIAQEIYNDGRIVQEEGRDTIEQARTLAYEMSSDMGMEGDYVRIITRDGEEVYDSRAVLSLSDLHNVKDNLRNARQILNDLHHDVATPWIKQRIHDAQQNLLAAHALLIGKKM